MGGTAQLIGRVAAGTLTLGATEAFGVGKKAGKLTSQAFLPGADKVGNALGNPNLTGSNRADPTAQSAAITPTTLGPTDAERERDARLASEHRRKKDFHNLGRSSTFLTGPGGLGGTGSGQQKTLIGS